MRVVLQGLAIGVAGGAASWAVGLPAPWLAGSMLAAVAAVFAGIRIGMPSWLRDVAFLLLGIQTGTSVSWETVDRAAQWPLSIAMLVAAMAAVTWACTRFYVRFRGWDMPTAFFASLPGALGMVVLLADRKGVDLRRVMVAQCIRLAFLVACLPALISLMSPGGIAEISQPHLGGLGDVALVVMLSAAAAQWALGWRPEWWSGWLGLLVDLVILDLWIYWWHRANHELPVLWRFHEVHHLDEFLDASSALRFHFGEVLLSALVRAAVIFLLDVPLASVLVFETFVAVNTIFHHSNLRLPGWAERSLSRLLVTPSIHWVHHHAIRADTDSNYASLLSVWDVAFGTRSPTRRTPEMKIGVEGRGDLALPGLAVRPLRRRS